MLKCAYICDFIPTMTSPTVVAALYQFSAIDAPESLVEQLRLVCAQAQTLGTLLVAHEGINGTISGSQSGVDQVLDFLRSDGRFNALSLKFSEAQGGTFYRMKVMLKKEIVTMGQANISPRDAVGTYVKPQDWNALISDPDTLVIDTRNDYEYRVGTFEGAIDPQTASFRQFPQWADEHLAAHRDKPTKIAMFCTGGIRCEKSTAYLLEQGFDEVYHLEGGILKYLEEVPEEHSLWRGECFVFDQRVAVGHGLQQGSYRLCHGCREPITAEDTQHEHFEEGVSCPRCRDSISEEKRASLRERQRQMRLARQRGEAHIGQKIDPK